MVISAEMVSDLSRRLESLGKKSFPADLWMGSH